MVPKITSVAVARPLCSLSCLFLSLSLVSLLFFFFFFFFSNSLLSVDPNLRISRDTFQTGINVFVAELLRSLNYGLLDKYWSSSPDSRIPSDPDHPTRKPNPPKPDKYPPYPENPLIKQYKYWMMGDLETPPEKRIGSFAKRVFSESEADVVFASFFATLSAKMELAREKGSSFRKRSGNEDYQRKP
ncbi:hypothetical protein N665_0974s0007 [Sinapis alba]|nr:hypothetical protein N665_0974s0007 [Sinapis alba]